jgi:PAS domain S-box-containing protein
MRMRTFEVEKLQTSDSEPGFKHEKSSSKIDYFNAIIDNTYEWVWEVDKNGVYTNVSEQVFSVLGYQPEEIIGKTPFDLMHKDEAERVGKIFAELASKQIPFSKLQNNCLHKDGYEVHVETSGRPIYDENGVFCGYTGIDFDRTEEIEAQQALQNSNTSLQEQLDEQHQLLLNVTNSISDLLFYKDTDLRYTGCNQAFSNFLGLPIDFIIGKTDYELFDKQYADIFRANDLIILESLQTHSNYEWVSHADGRKLYLLAQKSPLIDTCGKLIGLVGISRDLTKEHRLKDKLQQSTRHLIDAQSIAKVGHWEWDIQNGTLFWSDEIYKIFGYTPQEFGATYDAFLQTIHPEDRQMVADAVKDAIDNRSDYAIYHRIVLPDMTEKTVHELGHAVYDAEGKPQQMIGTVQDVTQMKRIEQELADQKEAFETIFEYAADGMALMEDGCFVACNQAAVEIMQVSGKEEFLNIHTSELSPEFQPDGQSSLQKADEMIAICIQQGYNNFEWVHVRKNGEEFWAEILLTRLSIKEKLIIHASFRDISERKALDKKLESANTLYKKLVDELDTKVKEQSAHIIKQSRMAQMGELLSMIAHQWRQPLSSIGVISSNVKITLSLAEEEEITQKSNDYINTKMDEIEDLLQSLSGTIDDFRTLYKPERSTKEVSLSTPIESALKLVDSSLQKNKIEVIKSYATDICVPAHSNEVMQVILNLIKNAEDNFLERNTLRPTLTIRTTESEESVKIDVCDNGGGIEDKVMEHIFDPYFSTKMKKTVPAWDCICARSS